jgi:hypothetical protein
MASDKNTHTRAVVEIEAKSPPEETWPASETCRTETSKYSSAGQPRVFEGFRWVLITDFPNAAAAERFTYMLNSAELKVHARKNDSSTWFVA